MKQRIDSTFYFFQYLVSRFSFIPISGMLIYSLVTEDIDGIIASSFGIIFLAFIIKKKIVSPTDLNFDDDFIYLNNNPEPIKIDRIKAIENGVIFYMNENEVLKIPLPKYYFIDKNFKNLKRLIKY